MSFLRNSVSFTRYALLDKISVELEASLPDILRRHAFRDIDDLPEERAWGWVAFEDMLDTEWRGAPPRKGGEYAAFALRLDTRRVPAAVLKKHYSLALRAEEEAIRAQGRNYVARERRKELRERTLLMLQKRFLPVPALFQVLWNLPAGRLLIATLSPKVLDLFEDHFTRSFDLRLERLSPLGLAGELLPDTDMNRLAALEAEGFA